LEKSVVPLAFLQKKRERKKEKERKKEGKNGNAILMEK
jgi:hypothetical protein